MKPTTHLDQPINKVIKDLGLLDTVENQIAVRGLVVYIKDTLLGLEKKSCSHCDWSISEEQIKAFFKYF